MINQCIYQIPVVLKITFKRFRRGLIEVYDIAERRVKLNKKRRSIAKPSLFFADNIGLIN